jgi:hypothetical protein
MAEARLRRRAQRPRSFLAVAALAGVLTVASAAVLFVLPHP